MVWESWNLPQTPRGTKTAKETIVSDEQFTDDEQRFLARLEAGDLELVSSTSQLPTLNQLIQATTSPADIIRKLIQDLLDRVSPTPWIAGYAKEWGMPSWHLQGILTGRLGLPALTPQQIQAILEYARGGKPELGEPMPEIWMQTFEQVCVWVFMQSQGPRVIDSDKLLVWGQMSARQLLNLAVNAGLSEVEKIWAQRAVKRDNSPYTRHAFICGLMLNTHIPQRRIFAIIDGVPDDMLQRYESYSNLESEEKRDRFLWSILQRSNIPRDRLFEVPELLAPITPLEATVLIKELAEREQVDLDLLYMFDQAVRREYEASLQEGSQQALSAPPQTALPPGSTR